jgi:hypothetical protein
MRRLHRDDGQHRGVPRGAHRRAGESGDVAGLDAGGQARERGPRGRREVRRVQPPPGRRVARRRRVQHRRSRPPAALHRRPAGGAEQGHRPGRRVTARLLPAAEERREVPGLRPRHGAKVDDNNLKPIDAGISSSADRPRTDEHIANSPLAFLPLKVAAAPRERRGVPARHPGIDRAN